MNRVVNSLSEGFWQILSNGKNQRANDVKLQVELLREKLENGKLQNAVKC